ncbi:glycine zipper 2TM domain-containing protein [Sphingomonas cavernae]|uniref:17 kDa surface antigen n=1 Tax=Sphingomonas cavernae TaxID=2320861 RepID=A0A418WRX9_9SPHN|nr:glycine zipper 2TM domain-containing protein [Sphingomonas cavernae]RJF94008.1 glycine zipper 2TM domain-containing protein [Sphingomonas cavernae]
MLRKISLFGAAMAMAVPATMVVPMTPALADDDRWEDDDDDNRRYHRGRDYRGDRYYGRDRGYRCRRSGTTGTIVGAAAGALLGREVVGYRGDRTAGAIVGAGVGALAGRAIDKSSGRCR